MKKILFLASLIVCEQAVLAGESTAPALQSEGSSAPNAIDSSRLLQPVFIRTYDYYAPNERVWTSLRVTATDVVSGEKFVQAPEFESWMYPIVKDLGLESAMAGSNGVIFIKPGRYQVSGYKGFCFLKEQYVSITEETSNIDLFVGCH